MEVIPTAAAITFEDEVQSPLAEDPKPLVDADDVNDDDDDVKASATEVKATVNDVKATMEDLKSPAAEEKISSLKEDEDPVSSSTPSKAASPEVVEGDEEEEENANADSSAAVEENALHLSGFFFSLEDRLPASLLDLIYWRRAVTSGCVFFSLFLLLLSFSLFSAISVVSHVALLFLSGTLSYVGFRKVAAAVQKSGEGHPFQDMLDYDVEGLLRVGDFQDVVKVALDHAIHFVDLFRSLFLIVNVFDSLKLVLALYAITYVGEAFHLLTLVIIALVVMFTVPKAYEVYGADMDLVAEKLLAHARAQWPVIKEQVVDRIMMIKEKAIAAIPIGKDKAA